MQQAKREFGATWQIPYLGLIGFSAVKANTKIAARPSFSKSFGFRNFGEQLIQINFDASRRTHAKRFEGVGLEATSPTCLMFSPSLNATRCHHPRKRMIQYSRDVGG
jgi:hypothetical protein